MVGLLLGLPQQFAPANWNSGCLPCHHQPLLWGSNPWQVKICQKSQSHIASAQWQSPVQPLTPTPCASRTDAVHRAPDLFFLLKARSEWIVKDATGPLRTDSQRSREKAKAWDKHLQNFWLVNIENVSACAKTTGNMSSSHKLGEVAEANKRQWMQDQKLPWDSANLCEPKHCHKCSSNLKGFSTRVFPKLVTT